MLLVPMWNLRFLIFFVKDLLKITTFVFFGGDGEAPFFAVFSKVVE